MQPVIETARLELRRFTPDDAAFVLSLLNDPGWLEFIGDKGIRTEDGARAYIQKSLMGLYERLGYGLYLVALKDGTPIGMCGLIKRDSLEDVDIGFAFLPAYCGQGYAREAAAAVLEYARKELQLTRVIAITMPENHNSVNLLQKIGLSFERMISMSPNEPPLLLLGCAL